jgi:hypothetical protein
MIYKTNITLATLLATRRKYVNNFPPIQPAPAILAKLTLADQVGTLLLKSVTSAKRAEKHPQLNNGGKSAVTVLFLSALVRSNKCWQRRCVKVNKKN